MRIFEVSSEEEAWKLLSAATATDWSEEHREEPIVLDFGKWAKLNIHLPETVIDGSMTPTMMEAFIELQKAIYRSYNLVSSEPHDLRYLTSAERERLEFRVEVNKGSSDYQADFTAILEKLGLEAIGKMDSQSLVTVVLGTALIIGSVVAFRSWLQARAETRERELDSDDRKEAMAIARAAIAGNTENTKILAAAIARQPILADIDAVVEPAREKLVQAVGREGGGDLYGVPVSSSLAGELSAQKRQQSQEVLIKGKFRVVRVDTTSPDGFRVTLIGDAVSNEVTATLTEYLISTDHREAIRRAEWGKKPVYVEMKARKLRDRIIEAEVIMADDTRYDDQ